MNSINKKKTALSLLLIFSTLVFQSWTVKVPPATHSKKRAFTGVEMYKGIFFFEGDFGNDSHTLQMVKEKMHNTPKKFESAKQQFQSEVIENISLIEPHYFDKLKETVEDGNYNEISDALTEGANLYSKAAKMSKTFGGTVKAGLEASSKIDMSKYDINSEEGRKALQAKLSLNNTQNNPDKNYCLAGAGVAIAVVWEVIWVVNVAIVATVYTRVAALSSENSLPLAQQSLTKEKLVVELSDAYSYAE